MGKAVGAIAGGFVQDEGIKSGVKSGRAGYGAQIASLRAGEERGLGYLNPYTDVGQGALSPLSAMLTGRSYNPETGEFTDLSPEERYASFETSPGYQFRMDQGMRSNQYMQNAGGSLLSGGALKELSQYNQGLASQEYGNYIGNLQQLAGIGQASAGQSANIATGTAGQIGAAQLGSANLQMQGRIARGQNQADTFATVGAAADEQQSQAAKMFASTQGSDISLKENIEEIGKSESGIPIYHFDYKDKKFGQFRYEGAMAQDLLKSNPDAVSKRDGHYMVDYDKIDVNFKRI
jgi:hypothetical protein